jgi:prolyl oligopeptidase
VPKLSSAAPLSAVDPVIEMLHGVTITDPYRWLEDQNSRETREWIKQQTRYARAYLDSIPSREQIRERIHQFLAVETYDSVQQIGGRYLFRKRLPEQEQPCIYMREGPEGQDQLLVDPSEQGRGIHTAVKPLRVSPDGKLLLYEIKEGGERTGTFALLDIETRRTLPDKLPHGYLRGFSFAPDAESFVYVHEALDSQRPFYRNANRHFLGTNFYEDQEVFAAGEDPSLRLVLIAGLNRIGFIVCRFGEKIRTSFYVTSLEEDSPAECVLSEAEYSFIPSLVGDRIFAMTNRDAPNLRIVEIHRRANQQPEWVDLIPQTDARIHQWLISGKHILVSYVYGTQSRVLLFDFEGKRLSEVMASSAGTIRIAGGSPESNEAFLETESFTEPVVTTRYCPHTGERNPWFRRNIPFDSAGFGHVRVWFRSKDGTSIPIFLVGRRDVLAEGHNPLIMTSYGGYGVPMTPQFSVFVAYLMERGCLFALPQIRGGSDFGSAWYEAAKGRKRQTAYDDFIAAAEWLIASGRTTADKLAIFGGSNSGLLVGAAMTQRPDLFRAVVCMVPMLDMLRYHQFDGAHVWRHELGTAQKVEDFRALVAYSPYHQVHDQVRYPAVMMVSGDADRNCNPLHARKMTARLQAASRSGYPVLIDYNPFRGHCPVLPLSERVEALTDRMAFLCDQLGLKI